MWFDLSPLRPDAWAATNARRWREATALRGAYQEGVADAKAEQRAAERVQARVAERMGTPR